VRTWARTSASRWTGTWVTATASNRWDGPTAAAALHALAPYDLLFFEEPLAYDDPEEYAQLRAESTVPIAGGEQLTSADEFRLWTSRGAFDIVQPDAAWLGLSDFMTVGAQAASDGAGIASHSWSAGGGVMQNLHVAFACSATVIVEAIPDPASCTPGCGATTSSSRTATCCPRRPPDSACSSATRPRTDSLSSPASRSFSSVPGKVLAS